jgi:hypothetical protein
MESAESKMLHATSSCLRFSSLLYTNEALWDKRIGAKNNQHIVVSFYFFKPSITSHTVGYSFIRFQQRSCKNAEPVSHISAYTVTRN